MPKLKIIFNYSITLNGNAVDSGGLGKVRRTNISNFSSKANEKRIILTFIWKNKWIHVWHGYGIRQINNNIQK